MVKLFVNIFSLLLLTYNIKYFPVKWTTKVTMEEDSTNTFKNKQRKNICWSLAVKQTSLNCRQTLKPASKLSNWGSGKKSRDSRMQKEHN